ncbi:hypothetical protein C8T65DRAFT_746730, partial [Cerioporus squamosus]
MWRVLSSYISYSPFAALRLLGDIPPMDTEPVQVRPESIAVAVQTEDLSPSPSPPGSPVIVAAEPVPAVAGDLQGLQEDAPSPLSTPRAPTPVLHPVAIDVPADEDDAPQNDAQSSTSPTVVIDPAEPPTPTGHDEELWFEDGNLSIVAGGVEFRIYKGPLMKQSGFFKDMLSLPQPSPSAGGSCATVQVSDSPEDMRHFLRAFVDGSLRYEPTFHEISAYIRLGHKYQCDKLVQRS